MRWANELLENREGRTVLRHLARGVHVKEIAFLMGCTARSVHLLLARLRARYGCNDNTRLVLKAIQTGLIGLPEEYEIVNPFRAKELRERRKVA